jgi:hypothetical protein
MQPWGSVLMVLNRRAFEDSEGYLSAFINERKGRRGLQRQKNMPLCKSLSVY